jgi:hypothetical protein
VFKVGAEPVSVFHVTDGQVIVNAVPSSTISVIDWPAATLSVGVELAVKVHVWIVPFAGFRAGVVPVTAKTASVTLLDTAKVVKAPVERVVAPTDVPLIVPPVRATVAASCVAIVPRPRLVRAAAAVDAPVPPSATARSVMPVIDPPVMATADAS